MARPTDERVPSEGDPIWKDLAKQLLEFVEEPRTWLALGRWAKERRWSGARLRNCIAWMETHHMVSSTGAGTRAKWAVFSSQRQPPSS